MLSRAGSDASNHLRRTKSAISVKQRRHESSIQEPINPETARVQAMTAANIAMGRAKERASIEMRRSAELVQCDSNAARSANRTTDRSHPVRFSPASELRRQRSILQGKGSSIVSSSHNPTENPYSDLSHYIIPPPSELGVIGYGSEPSSYRKLRKVKSVLTPRKRSMSMHNMSSCSPYSAHTLKNMKSSLGEAEQGLKLGLKRSISFLRGSSGNLSKAFKRVESETKVQDKAIQLAQEYFLNDLEQQRLRQKPSSFFSTKARQPQKAFRKTVRSSRTTTYGDGIKSANQDVYISKPESKSRSISASFRDKMKRMFGKSMSNKDKFPPQQLDASRPHFRDYIDPCGVESDLDQYFVGNNDATARGSLYIPSNHEHNPCEDLDQVSTTLRSAQSMESLHSNTSRSRVTSWTNSTTTNANSVGARFTPVERKRLSVIKEDGGPHQPSSSVGRHVGGIDVFQKPLLSQNAYGEPAQPVDSQRIYSALMKRIDQEQADAVSTRSPNTPINGEADILPSSARSRQTAPTIRAVVSEASLRSVAPDREHREFSIGSQSWREDSGMTPQELAQHNENIERRRARLAEQEQKSSFFPFSNQYKPQTPSPFKCALAARKEDSTTSQSESGSVVVNRSTKPEDQRRDKFAMSSDSIYSTTTNGHVNPQTTSGNASHDDTDESPPAGGIAVINLPKTARYPRPTPSLVQLHRARSTDRGEWKGSTENQMSTLDRRQSRASTSHRREYAQIDGEDTAVGGKSERPSTSRGVGTSLSRHASQRTLRNVTSDEITTVPLSRSSSVMNERFPLLDLKQVPRNSTPKPTTTELKHASMVGTNDENRKLSGADTQRKGSGGLRVRRSQVSLRYNARVGNSSSFTSPDRTQISGDLAASAASLKELTPTPKQRPKSQMSMANWGQFGINITNNSDRNLSRLSRPFDMDIPNDNRPFDSVYLGTQQSYVPVGRIGRLSVAPGTATGTPGYSGDDECGDTALPKVDDRSANPGRRKMTSSKRMVSNFLRSRRKHTPGKNEVEAAMSGSSPAFL